MNSKQLVTELKVQDNLDEGRLWFTNSPQATRVFRLTPIVFELSLHLSGELNTSDEELLVEVGPPDKPSWGQAKVRLTQLKNGYELKCRPFGDAAPGNLPLEIRFCNPVTRETLATISHPLKVSWMGHSGFDPAIHGYNFVNTSTAYGPVSLDRRLFERTFQVSLWPEKLYRKMYRDVLGATVDENGPLAGTAPLSSGLCTGMIRSAIGLYQEKVEPPASQRQPVGPTLETIKLYHGRQLGDQALLQAARWIVRGGPNRVFEAFKREVRQGNRDPYAFDIGVAAWGRKDFWRAIQAEGHTVIPYAFRQLDEQTGEIFIYDPNRPPLQADYGYANAPEGEEARLSGPVIHFDLPHNNYFYTEHYQSVRPNGNATTIVAVHQSAYRRGRSALLASLANRFI